MWNRPLSGKGAVFLRGGCRFETRETGFGKIGSSTNRICEKATIVTSYDAATSDHATLGSPTLSFFRETQSQTTAHSPDLAWLIRLRWVAALGQLVGYYIVRPTTAAWAEPWLLAIVGATVVSNVLLQQFRGRYAAWSLGSQTARSFLGTGAVLTFDCMLLTAWLGLTGGTTNPFTSLYLVHIVLGAVVLNARWTVWLIACATLCFGVLFLLPIHACCVAEPVGAESAYLSHMQGMWFSFATAAILISYFVRQLTLEAERQRERIAALRLEAERSAHMASLTTLAAGAAHELRTPLGTIAVAAHELRRNAERLGSADVLDDAALIAEEVERCQTILSGMGLRLRAGSEPKTRIDAGDVQRELAAEFGDGGGRLTMATPDPGLEVAGVRADLAMALRGLINNALDATERGGTVNVTCEAREGYVVWTIRDTGVGMPESVRARALEPFFTTKPAGKGVGLGLFVAHALATSSSGKITVDSQEREGTTVSLALPRWTEGDVA